MDVLEIEVTNDIIEVETNDISSIFEIEINPYIYYAGEIVPPEDIWAADVNYASVNVDVALDDLYAIKVDKATGYGLSKNDYSDQEKQTNADNANSIIAIQAEIDALDLTGNIKYLTCNTNVGGDGEVLASAQNLVIPTTGVLPTVNAITTLTPIDEDFDITSNILMAQLAYNSADDIWYYRNGANEIKRLLHTVSEIAISSIIYFGADEETAIYPDGNNLMFFDKTVTTPVSLNQLYSTTVSYWIVAGTGIAYDGIVGIGFDDVVPLCELEVLGTIQCTNSSHEVIFNSTQFIYRESTGVVNIGFSGTEVDNHYYFSNVIDVAPGVMTVDGLLVVTGNIYFDSDDSQIYKNDDDELGIIDSYFNTGALFKDFLTSETDPVFVASAAHGISAGDISNWNGAVAFMNNITGLEMISAPNVSTNTTISIPANSKVISIDFLRVSGTPIIKIGTTLGGDDIFAETSVSTNDGVTLNYRFTSSTTLYATVSGGTIYIQTTLIKNLF
jgi:hypothetical protein